jgi:hypothetical protein
VKFQTLGSYVFALMAALFLSACGGGGADNSSQQGGTLAVDPANATFYAGQPATISISGGRRPYTIISSEPGILPVPLTLDANTFQVVPNNPGVVDVGLPPGSLPIRTINVTVRDSTGLSAVAIIHVAQNYLTGYSMSFGASTCVGATPPCAGGDTTVFFDAVTNGSQHGGKTFRLDRLIGGFHFVNPDNSTTDSILVTSDHEGKIIVVIRADSSSTSQIGMLRVTEVASGVSTTQVFVISAGTVNNSALKLIPDKINFVGNDPNTCGSGTTDVLVFDGKPPYQAFAANPAIIVTTVDAGSQPGRFRVQILPTGQCMTNEPILFQDATGTARATLPVTTSKGPAPPAATKVTVAPATLTLNCGQSGSVTAVGGSGVYTATSNNSRVTAVVSGNTVTITRLIGDTAAGGSVATPFPTDAIISVTDGASIGTTDATVPGFCPP